MKKIIKSLVTCLILFLCSCSAEETTSENTIVKQEVPEETSILYEFTHGIKNFDGSTLELRDFNEFTYNIKNTNNEFDLGLIIFADGYLQQYKVENENNLSYLHSIHVEKEEEKDIKLFMENFILDNKDIHSFHIGGVLNPSVVNNLVSYQVNHSISQSIGINVNDSIDDYKVNSVIHDVDFKLKKITEEDKKAMEIRSEEELNQNMRISILQNDKEIKDYLNPDEDVELRITGDYGNYNLYIFVDGKPYKPNELIYPIESKKGYLTIQHITLPTEVKNNKNIFFVFAPKNTENYIEQSERYMIGSEESE